VRLMYVLEWNAKPRCRARRGEADRAHFHMNTEAAFTGTEFSRKTRE
jgi:hypothetical protein